MFPFFFHFSLWELFCHPPFHTIYNPDHDSHLTHPQTGSNMDVVSATSPACSWWRVMKLIGGGSHIWYMTQALSFLSYSYKATISHMSWASNWKNVIQISSKLLSWRKIHLPAQTHTPMQCMPIARLAIQTQAFFSLFFLKPRCIWAFTAIKVFFFLVWYVLGFLSFCSKPQADSW